MKTRHHWILLAVLISAITSQANGQIVADVDVNVTEVDGIYTYDYTVSNSILSGSSINGFLLTVARGEDTVITDPENFVSEVAGHSLPSPPDWSGAYQPYLVEPPCEPERRGAFAGDYQVAWVAGNGQEVSPTGEFDLFQGGTLNFSISSEFAPAPQDYLLINITPGCVDAEFLGIAEGTISAPGIAPAIPCDLDGDGDCDLADIDALSVEVSLGNNPADFDLTGDGNVNREDIDAYLALDDINKLNGDVDLNGSVEFADFLVLSDNFGMVAVWSGGDLTGTGNVEFADFLVLSDNFGKTSATLSSVPEPNAAVLVLTLLSCLLPLRRRIRN